MEYWGHKTEAAPEERGKNCPEKKKGDWGKGLASCAGRDGQGRKSGMWGPLVGRPEAHRVLEGGAGEPEECE